MRKGKRLSGSKSASVIRTPSCLFALQPTAATRSERFAFSACCLEFFPLLKRSEKCKCLAVSCYRPVRLWNARESLEVYCILLCGHPLTIRQFEYPFYGLTCMTRASLQRSLSFHHPADKAISRAASISPRKLIPTLNESRELDKGFGRRSFFMSVTALRELTASGDDVDALGFVADSLLPGLARKRARKR
jgi:hypothetical protein